MSRSLAGDAGRHQVSHGEELFSSPAWGLAQEAAREGAGFPDMLDYVVWATSPEGDVVGVLAWEMDPGTECSRATCAYVEPSSRGQGVFRALVRRAVHEAGDLEFEVDSNDEVATEAVLRVGGLPMRVVLRVPDPDDATGG